MQTIFIVFTQRDTHELEAIFVDFLPNYIFFMELSKAKKKKSTFQMLTQNQIPSSRELFHICS